MSPPAGCACSTPPGSMGELRVELADRFRQQTIVLVGAMITISGLVGAAAFAV